MEKGSFAKLLLNSIIHPIIRKLCLNFKFIHFPQILEGKGKNINQSFSENYLFNYLAKFNFLA